MEKIHINNFKKNFCCDNESSIIDMFSKKNDIKLFNNQVIFKTEKYLHPLFLNYNYCFFCYNKRKTKYFMKNLIKSHINDISLFDYMKNKNISLKKAKNKNERLIRRFIHSIDKDKENKIHNNNICSDTELYIDYNIKCNVITDKANIYNNNNIIEKDNYKTNCSKSEELSSITLEENSKSKGTNLDMNIKIKDDIKKENNNEKMMKIKSHVINENQLKFRLPQENNLKKEDNSNIKNILNKSSDFMLINENEKLKSQTNYFSVLKNFMVDKVRKVQKPNSIRKHKKKQNEIFGNNIKNDYCSICLGEILEKYTLICGDYFCRECLYERIKSILKCIADFDKIRCPLCNEPIEENTLKRLLNDDEFNFYEKIKMRIEGLKNKNLIPCPFPDCEGFANKSDIHKNCIFICQNNHYFCGRCKEVVDKKFLLPKNKHLCENKYPKTMKYFKFKKKRNKIKKCPNCDCWVQKEQNSCNNVICSNIWCNFEFCWICKAPYDEYHYKNPFSMCFGLSSINSENYFTKNKRMRLIRCMIIILFIIFIFLPFCIAFFSLLIIFIYVFGFLIEKSGLRNVKLKSRFAHKIFYQIFLLFYLFISIGLIPIGHLSFMLIISITPFIFLIKRIKNNDDFD